MTQTTENTPIQATFAVVKAGKIGLTQLIFDVNEDEADKAIQALGGYPTRAEPKICAIVLLND